jgi:hypothetical protein
MSGTAAHGAAPPSAAPIEFYAAHGKSYPSIFAPQPFLKYGTLYDGHNLSRTLLETIRVLGRTMQARAARAGTDGFRPS